MIRDSAALEEIQQEWAGVVALRVKLDLSAASSSIVGGMFPFALADAAHNLPFIHAFAVLNNVLAQLAREGRFQCNSIFLGKLLASSEKALPWQDFARIRAGVERRNDGFLRRDDVHLEQGVILLP